MNPEIITDGGYRYIPAESQYSGGVVPEPGLEAFSYTVPDTDAAPGFIASGELGYARQ